MYIFPEMSQGDGGLNLILTILFVPSKVKVWQLEMCHKAEKILQDTVESKGEQISTGRTREDFF